MALSMRLSRGGSKKRPYYRIVIAQEDEYLFLSMAVSLTEDGNESADDLADYLVNEGEESDDDPEFEVSGSSTGGLWGFFPDDDEDFIGDLVPAGDEITFPVPDEDE